MDEYRIYDTVLADTLGEPENMPEHVAIANDFIIVSKVTKDGDAISITGESQVTGDDVYRILPWDQEVDLWTYA